jgi:hypothetical protein
MDLNVIRQASQEAMGERDSLRKTAAQFEDLRDTEVPQAMRPHRTT